ncbi:MAG TPA: hypothetical protein VLE97_09585 [Gaiellaceae bacterium]|nr:hypothetical protein [Gaiellaceae bacterium]
MNTAAKKPQPAPADDTVDEIVARGAAYRHHPKFRRAVVEAKNLVTNYRDEHNLKRIGAHDQDLIERIACAIHSARIERGY